VEILVQNSRNGDDGELAFEVVEASGPKGGDTHRITFPMTPVFGPHGREPAGRNERPRTRA